MPRSTRNFVTCLGFAMLLTLTVNPSARGELFILRSGDRIEGEIVSSSGNTITISRTYRGSVIRYEQKLKRSDIVRIEQTPAPAGEDEEAASTGPAETENKRDPSEVLLSLVDEAVDSFEKKAYARAGRLLTSFINRASESERHEASIEIKSRLDVTLAQLAAEAHIRDAMSLSEGRSRRFRLRYVTGYEKSALIPRLDTMYREARQKRFGDDPAPAVPEILATRQDNNRAPAPTDNAAAGTAGAEVASDPAAMVPAKRAIPTIKEDERATEADVKPAVSNDNQAKPKDREPVGFCINEWIGRPEHFNADPLLAAIFSEHIRDTIALLEERSEHDLQVRMHYDLRVLLQQDKVDLVNLLDHVMRRAGGELTVAERAGRLEEIQRLHDLYREDERRRMDDARFHDKNITPLNRDKINLP